MTGRGWRWLLGAVAALLVAWLVAPAAVPIYDGPGNPDEPYRYVKPPAGVTSSKAPTTGHTTLTVNQSGLSGSGYANSGESGPQIVLYVPSGALKAPAGATQITVTETPLAPSAPLPRDGTIVTNVYRITATTPNGVAQVVGRGDTGTPSLQMRAPNGNQPGPVFEHRTAAGWTQSATLRVGSDIYQTQAPVFGDWALVQLRDHAKSSGGVNVALLSIGIAVLVLAGIIIGIRIARTRS